MHPCAWIGVEAGIHWRFSPVEWEHNMTTTSDPRTQRDQGYLDVGALELWDGRGRSGVGVVIEFQHHDGLFSLPGIRSLIV